ncbi:hypothetical protein FNV43_RR14673 [Rhamnella rubrinervis]|uniref:Uncharacterized protein n=1 Tax=Rhamnella rubrinervis TaxID=2594499 RepID=A0A8K0MGK8_9ROSA|nr:hypothetical protein FNV43_RR14673 [Rhamnella rubrinervis]
MEPHNSLPHQPLLPNAAPTNFDDDDARKTKTSSSNCGIVIRLLTIFFIGIISVWANFEASKGFDLTIINEDQHSLPGKRFHLFYVSNDKATRILLNASKFVEHLLYDIPNVDHHWQYPKKQVSHVTLRLASRNLSEPVAVHPSSGEESGFVIDLNPQIMEDANVNHALASAIQRGMARVWLWDGKSRAPPELLAGIVEYISMVAGVGDVKSYRITGEWPECGRYVWWVDEDPKAVAKCLSYLEDKERGFIQRLNGGMKDRWHDRTVYDAVGVEAQQHLCG